MSAEKAKLEAGTAAFNDKMSYINLQINMLEPDESVKFNDDFKVVGKSMNMLRNAMLRKEAKPFEWDWKLFGCVVLLITLIGLGQKKNCQGSCLPIY